MARCWSATMSSDFFDTFRTAIRETVRFNWGNRSLKAAKNYADDVRQGTYPESRIVRRDRAPVFAVK